MNSESLQPHSVTCPECGQAITFDPRHASADVPCPICLAPVTLSSTTPSPSQDWESGIIQPGKLELIPTPSFRDHDAPQQFLPSPRKLGFAPGQARLKFPETTQGRFALAFILTTILALAGYWLHQRHQARQTIKQDLITLNLKIQSGEFTGFADSITQFMVHLQMNHQHLHKTEIAQIYDLAGIYQFFADLESHQAITFDPNVMKRYLLDGDPQWKQSLDNWGKKISISQSKLDELEKLSRDLINKL